VRANPNWRYVNPMHVGRLMRQDALTAATKYQQLSNTEGGAFDLQKFRTVVSDDITKPGRRMVTAWERISQDRAKRGVSRRARILAKRAA
jgi:hypothetical protein